MERPDDPFGAMTEAHQYGAKRTVKQRERALRGSGRSSLLDFDPLSGGDWKRLPRNFLRTASGQVLGSAAIDVGESVWEGANRQQQLYRQAWADNDTVMNLKNKNSNAFNTWNIMNKHVQTAKSYGGGMEDAVRSYYQPIVIDTVKERILSGDITNSKGEPIDLDTYTPEMLEYATRDIQDQIVKERLEGFKKVHSLGLKAPSAEEFDSLINSHNLRSRGIVDDFGNLLRFRDKESLDIRALENFKNTNTFKNSSALQAGAVEFEKTGNAEAIRTSLDEFTKLKELNNINFQEVISARTIITTDTEKGTQERALETVSWNSQTGEYTTDIQAIPGTEQKTAANALPNVLKAMPTPNQIVRLYKFNPEFELSIQKAIAEEFQDKDGNPFNLDNPYQYREEKDILKTMYKITSRINEMARTATPIQFLSTAAASNHKEALAIGRDIESRIQQGRIDIPEASSLEEAMISNSININNYTREFARPAFSVGVNKEGGQEIQRFRDYTMPYEGFNLETADDKGTPIIGANGQLLMKPDGRIPLDRRVIALENWERTLRKEAGLDPIQIQKHLKDMKLKDKVDLVGTDEEKANLLKGVEIKTEKEVEKEASASLMGTPTLEQLAKDVTEEVFTREGSEKRQTTKIKFKANANRVFSGKNKLTYREMERLVERDLLSNPEKTRRSLVAMSRDKDKSGRTGIAARKLTQNYEKALEKAGYTLADAQKISEWYAANQEAIVAAIGTNQDLFDVFTKQGAAGLYQKFNRTPDLIASAQ